MTQIKTMCAIPACLAAGMVMLPGRVALGQAAPDSSLDKKLDSPFLSFKLGVAVSPVASVDTGFDITFPRLRLGPSWTTRFDLDLTARFNSHSFGSRRDAEIWTSVCQVYTPGGVNRGRYFLGAGLGPSIGPRTGIAGKVFGGVNFTPVVSLEAEAHFPPSSGVRAVLMLRLSAL
jgi:hypothetical protein